MQIIHHNLKKIAMHLLLSCAVGTCLVVSLLVLNPHQIHAQTATDSANTNTQDSEESFSDTTKNLRERIERIVDERREQIKGALSEIDTQRRGVIGEVQRVTEDSLTIRSQAGTEIIPLTNTRYPVSILNDGDSITFDEIAVGSWLLALGTIEEDTFQPIRLLISEDSLRPRTRSVSIGTITELGRTSIEIEQRSGDGTVSYTTNRSTRYEDLNGETITSADLDETMQAVVAGIVTNSDEDTEENAETVRTALLVRVLTTVQNDE